MKILAILTGGTIGSSFCKEFISLDSNSKNTLLEGYSHLEIDTIHPYTILSEQLNGEYLSTLIECVGENLCKDYEGIIVTHGTDTLQYSASALSLAYGNSEIPIVLVSSNYVLSDPKANGKDNFKYAVEFIKENIGGVFVSYKNTGGNPEIHQGNMLLPHEIYSDDVKSIGGAFGYFENEKFIQSCKPKSFDTVKSLKLSKTSSILWLKIHPGMALPDLSQYKAVMLEAYHSGTLPTLSEEFRSFCKNAKIPLFLIGAKEGPQYDSVKEYEELGIRHIPFISPIYAYLRLWFEAEGEANYDKAYRELCS